MSEQDRKVGIKVVAENGASATFWEIKTDAATMAASVGAAGEQAAKGIKEIGGSAEASEAKVERARGRITAELIRITEQTRIAAEAGGSLAKAFEIKADMRGVNVSALAPAIANLRQYESSLSVSMAAEAEFAAQNIFAGKAAQAQSLNKASEYMRWWGGELEKAEQAEKEFAAQNAFASKAAQVQELNKAREYARWWGAELEKVEQAERKLASESSFIASLREQSEAIGKTRADLLELKAAQMGLATQAAPHIAKLRESEKAIGGVGKTAGELQWALRGVPAQLSDIAVSLQGGMPVMTVFMQQGLQLRDMFGGFGAAAKGVASTVGGMINPFTLAGAAVAGLGLAYYSGSKEQDAFVRSLTLTGNTSGLSAGQLREYAREIDNVVGTQAKAAEGLVAFVNAGVKGGEELRRYTQTAIEWERATGQAIEKTAEQFASLQKDPLYAVQKLNEGTNFLTVSVYEQVKALQDQGRESEAAQVAMGALDEAMRERAVSIEQSLGIIERAWRRIKGEAAEVLDMVRGVGRPPTQLDELQRVRTLIANKEVGLETYKNTVAGKEVQEDIVKLRKQEWDLMASLNDELQLGVSKAADQRALAARVASDKASEKYKSKSDRRDDELGARKRVYDELIETNGFGFNTAQLAKEKATYEADVAAINKKYEEKSKSGSGKPARDALSIDINATKRDLEVLAASYASSQKIMEAQRSAGLIDDKAYYQEKRKYINLEADAQDKLLQAEMDRYKREKVTKDNRLQVEKGIADTQAKMDKAKMERSTALKVLDIQQTAAINAQAASIKAAEQAAKDYLFTLQKGFDRTVDAVGWGSERRNVESGRQQIEDRYTQQRRDVENQRAQIELQTGTVLNAQQQELYNKRLAIIDNYEALALQSYEGGVARRLEAEGHWLNGVSRAWQDYSSSAANVAQMSADAFTNAFKGMENSLVTFVTTGKLSFTDMANGIVADITRIIIKQQISNALGVAGSGGSGGNGLMGLIGAGIGMFGGSGAVASAASALPGDSLDNFLSLSGLVANAQGGVYDSPGLSSYSNQIHDTPKFFAFAKGAGVFGEAGPEAIMPLTRAPDGNLGVRASGAGGQGSTTHINVTVQMPQGGSRETALQFGRTVGRQIQVAQSRNG